jgi:hypothetical protein
MKTLTVKITDQVDAAIRAEARERGISKSDVVRERLVVPGARLSDPLADIADLIGSVDDDLPPDLSDRTEEHLRKTGFGRDRHR